MKTATCAGGPNLIWLFLIFFTVLFEGKAFIKSVIQSFTKKIKSKILRQHRMQFCESSKEPHDISEHATTSWLWFKN